MHYISFLCDLARMAAQELARLGGHLTSFGVENNG
jgi:hypothetical protein